MSLVMSHASAPPVDIPPALIIPFGLLLLLIAVMPLSPARVHHLWERFYPHVALTLGLAVAAYYLLRIPEGGTTIQDTLLEYFAFISLIGSLFVVAGGIHLRFKGESTPRDNFVFLAVGALITNVIGTTGASMLLIRPWIRMNKYRITAFHVIFFIFIISNAGGGMTPIGDPPLFLGFLQGVPFFWLIGNAALPWMATVGLLLALFYVLDRRNFAKVPLPVRDHAAEPDTWRFDGRVNLLFLAIVVGAVFLPPFLREGVMISAAVASYKLTPRRVHEENHFDFGPIKEVAWLFIGIFLTMMPALDYLETHGEEFGLTEPLQYYFSTGFLSAVLDNAPTYLTFLKLAETTVVGPGASDGVAVLLEQAPELVIAVSLGAVFFGAMTYIGNGPNFMVKSIAHGAGVKVPTFFGYVVKFSLPMLLPILALVGWLFLR